MSSMTQSRPRDAALLRGIKSSGLGKPSVRKHATLIAKQLNQQRLPGKERQQRTVLRRQLHRDHSALTSPCSVTDRQLDSNKTKSCSPIVFDPSNIVLRTLDLRRDRTFRQSARHHLITSLDCTCAATCASTSRPAPARAHRSPTQLLPTLTRTNRSRGFPRVRRPCWPGRRERHVFQQPSRRVVDHCLLQSRRPRVLC